MSESESSIGAAELAAGFELWPRTSPFAAAAGPLLFRRKPRLTFALRIRDGHTNARGTAHGGALSTVADLALGYASALSTDPPTSLHTINLGVDFIAPVHVGDLLIIEPQVLRVGSRLAHGQAVLCVGDRVIGRASSVMAVAGQRT